MAAFSLTMWILLFVVVVVIPAAVGQEIITADFGQNVTLLCQAPNNRTIHVEWRRIDLGKEYVLLYRDDRFDLGNQHQSFINRVDLNRQMKHGDVSLILKNVSINDTGTYECHVLERVGEELRVICIIYLRVDPPGLTGGETEDGGKEAEGKEAEGKEAGGKKAEEKNAKFYLLEIGSSVIAVLFLVVSFLIYRKRKAQQKQVSYQPPIEIQLV